MHGFDFCKIIKPRLEPRTFPGFMLITCLKNVFLKKCHFSCRWLVASLASPFLTSGWPSRKATPFFLLRALLAVTLVTRPEVTLSRRPELLRCLTSPPDVWTSSSSSLLLRRDLVDVLRRDVKFLRNFLIFSASIPWKISGSPSRRLVTMGCCDVMGGSVWASSVAMVM